MSKVKISQEQYNELCACGKSNFVNHNLYLITWLTFFKKFAICEDVREETFELVELVIEK